MTWFTPTNRTDHPCQLPNDVETDTHRHGEFWRCDTCGDLWWLDRGTGLRPTEFVRAGWWLRWRYRRHGHPTPPSTQDTP